MKKQLIYLLVALLSTALFMTSCITKPENRDGNKRVYKVGDKGPAKGIVFYDKGYYENEDDWRYLEAAPADTISLQADWGLLGIPCPGTAQEIGAGSSNTMAIVNKLRENGQYNKAAQLCNELIINNKDDWFLPSREELNVYYRVLALDDSSGYFDKDEESYYWSSSTGALQNKYTWFKRFSDGAMFLFTDDIDRDASFLKVIPIRAF